MEPGSTGIQERAIMTQKERIIDYIRLHGSITTMEAFNNLHVTRLAARIAELKSDGYKIGCTIVTKQTANGPVRFGRYYQI